jgi:hypothetical protein
MMKIARTVGVDQLDVEDLSIMAVDDKPSTNNAPGSIALSRDGNVFINTGSRGWRSILTSEIINVAKLASSGDGSQSNPWIFDTGNPFATARAESMRTKSIDIFFDEGYYIVTNPFTWNTSNVDGSYGIFGNGLHIFGKGEKSAICGVGTLDHVVVFSSEDEAHVFYWNIHDISVYANCRKQTVKIGEKFKLYCNGFQVDRLNVANYLTDYSSNENGGLPHTGEGNGQCALRFENCFQCYFRNLCATISSQLPGSIFNGTSDQPISLRDPDSGLGSAALLLSYVRYTTISGSFSSLYLKDRTIDDPYNPAPVGFAECGYGANLLIKDCCYSITITNTNLEIGSLGVAILNDRTMDTRNAQQMIFQSLNTSMIKDAQIMIDSQSNDVIKLEQQYMWFPAWIVPTTTESRKVGIFNKGIVKLGLINYVPDLYANAILDQNVFVEHINNTLEDMKIDDIVNEFPSLPSSFFKNRQLPLL